MAKKKKNNPHKRERRGAASLPMVISISIALIVIIKSSFIFIAIGLIPAITIYYTDLSSSRIYYRAVIACNATGVLPYAASLIAKGNEKASFLALASEPIVWFNIYLSAAAGWVLVWICPKVTEFVLELMYQGRIAHLESSQRRLIREWGPEICRAQPEF